MTNDPKNPEYNAKARDAIMDLCPFYDPNHKCGIVREHVFKECLTELRERERLAVESAKRHDALSSAGMRQILELERIRDTMAKMEYNHRYEREKMSRVIRRLVRYADRVAERHPQAVTINGQNARVEGGIWLAEFDRQNVQAMASADTQTPKENGQP